MPPLTQEQFQKARDTGFTTEQIIEFEKKRLSGEETKPLSFEEKIIQEGKQEEKKIGKVGMAITDYFLPQAITEKKFERGQQNVFGDVLSRPGAAIRSAIFPKEGESRLQAYQRGAAIPEEVPSAKESVYLKTGIQPTGNKLLDFTRTYPSAFVGEAIDIGTQPANYLGGLIGKFLGKGATKELGKAKELVKSTTDEIMTSPLAETAKRGFVNAVDNIKNIGNKFPKKMDRNWLISQSQNTFNVADDTVKGIQEEYKYLYDEIDIGKISVEPTQVTNVISNLLRGATKEEADDIINSLKNEMGQELLPNLNTVKKIKDIVQSDIPEQVWMRGKKGIDLTPAQARKVKAYFKLKDITEKTLSGTEEGEYLKYLDKKATDTYRLSKVVKRMVVDQTGQPTETGRLVSTFSGKAQQAGKENLFYRLKELNENAQEVITNMNKFRKRQLLKKWGLKGGIGLGLEEIIRRNIPLGR